MRVGLGVAEAVRWTGADRLGGAANAHFGSVSIDTRTLEPGALFVAIRGPRYDAHRLLGAALEAGARGLLVERGRARGDWGDVPVLAVDDTTRALGALAAGHRAAFTGPVVAITGSNGKTSTKEMCAAILDRRGPCLRNRGNLNNQFGLPLTLLEREPAHRALVVEIGMNHRGEIAPLAAIARPTVGVITNVGTAHIEHLGSQEEIALEKGDLVASLDADAVAVLNADDPRVMAAAARTRARVVRFGRAADAEVRAESVSARCDGGFDFALVTPEGRAAVHLEALAEVAVQNALAAAAAARAAGASLDDLAAGLAEYRAVDGRMQPRTLPGGARLIDDTYNANPQSMEAALASLARLKGGGRAIAVLGDMGELGEDAASAHLDVGRRVAGLGIDFLVVLGEHAGETAEGARAAGLPAERVHRAESHAGAGERAGAVAGPGDWILIKGSRAMRMEQVVRALGAEGEGPA